MEHLVHATRRKALSAAAALVLFSLGCSTDQTSLTESGDGSAPAAAAPSRTGLDVQVTLASELRGNGPVVARVSVTNITSAPIEIAENELPSEDMETSQFVVMRDGARVRYEGPHIKRGPETAVAMVRIEPGATMNYDIELSRAYDLTRDGSYSVVFEQRRAAAQATLRSARHEVRLYGRTTLATGGIADRSLASLTSQVSYSKCTTTQAQQVLAALNQASAYAAESNGYLASTTSGTPRYTQWFGAFSSSNLTKVRSNFAAIASAFETKPITVDCGCKKTYFAYVYANQPYKIYVCRAFCSAPLAGTDSKGGTLIHEMSHFTAVAGTGDLVYGQTAAANLAVTNPAGAITNADNHEYFAENTPKKN